MLCYTVGVLRGQCNGCVEFEFNDIKSLYMKKLMSEDSLSFHNIIDIKKISFNIIQ